MTLAQRDRPQARTVALVTLAFVTLLGAYLLGRSDSTSAQPASIEDAAITPTAIAGLAEETPGGLLTDLSSAGELLGQVVFDERQTGFVLCLPDPTSGAGRLSVGHLDATMTPPSLLAFAEISSNAICNECTMDVDSLASATVGVGNCPTDFPRHASAPEIETSMSFVVAQPSVGVTSAAAIVLDCGVTRLQVEGDELVLRSARPAPSFIPVAANPIIKFAHGASRFEADDLPLLRHYCDVSGSKQLFGSEPDEGPFYGTGERLAYLETESELGRIGFRRQVLVAITPQQCSTLRDIETERLAGGTTTMAEVTGLTPPAGQEDWYLVCQLR